MTHPFREPGALPAPPPPDEYEKELARQIATRRRRMAGAAVLLLLIVASPFLYMGYGIVDASLRKSRALRAAQLDENGRRELDELLARSHAVFEEREAKRRAALAPEALDALEIGRTKCPAYLSAPTYGAAESYTKHGSIDGNYFGSWSYSIGVESGKGQSVDEFMLDRIREKAKRGEALKDDLVSAHRMVDGADRNARSVVVVPTSSSAPVAFGVLGEYTGGTLVGRAYLYSVREGRVICAGDIAARNSSSIDIQYYQRGSFDTSARSQALRTALQRDLEVQTRRAISENLFAVLR